MPTTNQPQKEGGQLAPGEGFTPIDLSLTPEQEARFKSLWAWTEESKYSNVVMGGPLPPPPRWPGR